MEIRVGQTASIIRKVRHADTADAVGSGDLPVLGTPILVAWMEAAAVEVCGSTDAETTVGTRVGIDHHRPSGVGTTVTCTAKVAEIDGRLVTFKVKATQQVDGEEVLVGRGVVTRAVVDRDRFMARVQGPGHR
jgi:predicted thioesterase